MRTSYRKYPPENNRRFASSVNSKLNHVLQWLQLQVEKGWRPLMELPLPMTTVMGLLHDNEKLQWRWQECFFSVRQWIQWWELATYTRCQQQHRETNRDFIEALTEGILW